MEKTSKHIINIEKIKKNSIETSYMSFGNLNPDKRFYVIWRELGGAGFFSNMFHVLGHILHAEKLGMIPVVDMENFPTFYTDIDISYTKNAWEYFFSQVSPFTLAEVYQSQHVYFCSGKFNYDVYRKQSIENLHKMINKYIVLNEKTLVEISQYKKHFKDNTVLAVHLRGQDMKYVRGEHATPPSLKQIINSIDIMLEKYPIDKIFLATDEQEYLDEIVRIYTDKVFYVQSERASFIPPQKQGGKMYHLTTLESSKYQLALDVILDAYLLATGDYFIASGHEGKASGSNVSRYSQCLKGKFKDEILIYNGLNKDSVTMLKKEPVPAPKKEPVTIPEKESVTTLIEDSPSNFSENSTACKVHKHLISDKVKKININILSAFIPVRKCIDASREKLKKTFTYKN